MTVEAAGYINAIDPTLPLGTDAKSEGDDHLRNFKKSVQDSFPNITGAMTLTHTQLNKAAYLDGGNVNSLLFYQSAAPTGWTKNTTAALNDHALKIVTSEAWVGGTQGTSAFSTVFGKTATDSHTLTSAQSGVPAHTHLMTSDGVPQGSSGTGADRNSGTSRSSPTDANTAADAASGHTHNMDIRVKYLDMIIASKD